MKFNKKEAFKGTAGLTVIIAHLAKFAKAQSGAEFLRLLCRILGVPLPLRVAIAIRIILLSLSGWAAIDAIRKICPELIEKLRSRKFRMPEEPAVA